MISVLKKRRDTEGESHGKTEAEMGGIESQPRNAGLQEAGRSQRRVVLKNVQTTRQLHSSPMLVRSDMLGFSIT